jgi:hypothetical protein
MSATTALIAALRKRGPPLVLIQTGRQIASVIAPRLVSEARAGQRCR